MKNKNHFLSSAFIFIMLLCSTSSCSKKNAVFSKELERKFERIEINKTFSLDTIQNEEWTHVCIVLPYMNLDSLIIANGIKCKEEDLLELKSLTMSDNINTLLFLMDNTLKRTEILSRSIADFSDIVQIHSIIFEHKQTLTINNDRSVSISKDF